MPTTSGKQTSLPRLHSSKNASSVGLSFSFGSPQLQWLVHLLCSWASIIIHYLLAYLLLKSVFLNHVEKLTWILKKGAQVKP